MEPVSKATLITITLADLWWIVGGLLSIVVGLGFFIIKNERRIILENQKALEQKLAGMLKDINEDIEELEKSFHLLDKKTAIAKAVLDLRSD